MQSFLETLQYCDSHDTGIVLKSYCARAMLNFVERKNRMAALN